MVILITGASHTGKTLQAQKLMERYKYPYFSIDLLKMGLIRSGYTELTPEDDPQLEAYLWPVVREMIKTAIENKQNLIVEGCYIPCSWQADFDEPYRKEIRCCCLVMSQEYIRRHFAEIRRYANVTEQRKDDTGCTLEFLLAENLHYFHMCRANGCPMLLIEDRYPEEIDEKLLFGE